MPAVEPQQIPTIVWLLQSGGLVPLALGLFLAIIGIVYVLRPHRRASLMLGFLSLLPALIGLIAVYSAATDYGELAAAPAALKPAEFAAITGRAMSVSFCALLGTVLAELVAVVAMARSTKPLAESEEAVRSGAVRQ